MMMLIRCFRVWDHHAAALAIAGAAACAFAAGLGGCTQRSIEVTSDPPGAMVWLNDQQVGRTPCETGFKFYGDYDVRLVLDGYEPLATHRKCDPPVNEWVGIDLATAALPIHNRVQWHFVLQKSPEAMDKGKAEQDLIARARALRQEAATTPGAPTEGGKGDGAIKKK